jgi:putative hydrolase of the HAD superfamily
MKAVQAAWYLKDGTTQPSKRKQDFNQIENPLDVVKLVDV